MTGSTRTVGEVLNGMTEDKRRSVYFLIGEAVSIGDSPYASHLKCLTEEEKATAKYLLNEAIEKVFTDG